LPDEQEITIKSSALQHVKIFKSASDAQGEITGNREIKVKINPLSAIMVTYSN